MFQINFWKTNSEGRTQSDLTENLCGTVFVKFLTLKYEHGTSNMARKIAYVAVSSAAYAGISRKLHVRV
jgi:hypothetical protein